MACAEVVGTFLTKNVDSERNVDVDRSLISLTNGGHLFLTDSNEGGEAGFAPFIEGRGAWRCVSDEAGKLHILATVSDFTHKKKVFPDRRMACLGYDATIDAASGQLNAEVRLYFMPIDAEPIDAVSLKDPIPNRSLGVRITSP